jgi:serine/threonine protein kinase
MEDPLQPGLLLVDRFRVARRIAQGGMGVVYEAYDEKLGRRIALKCARVGFDRRLRPEVRLATEVSHPNICKIYEIHSTRGPQEPIEFFTMELLEGPTLSSRLREDPPLSPSEAEAIARGLCAGLAEAHRLQVIHGDLKSANIILARNPDGTVRPVITDFGLARASSVSGATGGTPGYMAPELYDGAPTTIASDIYALGVILREMVSVNLPQEHTAVRASTVTLGPSGAAMTPDRYTKLPPFRSRWDKIVNTCLRNDPRERYQTADQVLTALGPSVLRRRVLLGVGVLAFAAIAAFATYRTSTAPAQSVKLDVAAVESPPALAASATELRRNAIRVIGSLKDSAQTAFSVRSANWGTRATHRFSTSLTPKGDKLALHAVLTDLRSGAPVIEWSADYAPAQLPWRAWSAGRCTFRQSLPTPPSARMPRPLTSAASLFLMTTVS